MSDQQAPTVVVRAEEVRVGDRYVSLWGEREVLKVKHAPGRARIEWAAGHAALDAVKPVTIRRPA